MKTFKDTKNRDWTIDVNGATVIRVKGMCNVLLPELISGNVANELAADPVRLLSVLWAICKPEADDRKVDELAFQSLIGGDSLDGAIDALIDEVVSFFPKSRRPLAQEMVAKGRAVQELASQRAIDKLARATPEQILARAIKQQRATDRSPASPTVTTPGESSGSSPASSGSSRAD